MQKAMAEEMRIATVVVFGILSLIVTVLILRAGVKLVKSKKDAVKASTIYSFASIGAKIMALILAVTYTIPIAMNRHFDESWPNRRGAGGPQLESIMEMMKMMTSVSGGHFALS